MQLTSGAVIRLCTVTVPGDTAVAHRYPFSKFTFLPDDAPPLLLTVPRPHGTHLPALAALRKGAIFASQRMGGTEKACTQVRTISHYESYPAMARPTPSCTVPQNRTQYMRPAAHPTRLSPSNHSSSISSRNQSPSPSTSRFVDN